MLITAIVKTGARQDAVSYDTATKTYMVSVKARPIEGEANKVIIALLAKHIGVSKTQITLKSGAKSRIKRFEY